MSMPLNVLEVEPAVAEAKLRSYRLAFRETRRVEDRQIARGFAEIKKGRQVIALSDTIRAGGLDELGRPHLAVVRATAKTCFLRTRVDVVTYSDVHSWAIRSGQTREIEPGTRGLSIPFPGATWGRSEYEAIVPIIPPEHRPRIGRGLAKLDGFHILWEAVWTTSRAPRDPALLRHLHGDLWAVHAVWDLTDLERAVLVGSRGR